MTPMSLSLEFMRKQGWYVEVTEQNVRIVRPGDRTCPTCRQVIERGDLTFKRDLFGFADMLCTKKGRRLLVQTTTLSNIAARVNKICGLLTFEHAKQAGFEIQVHGWGSPRIAGGLRVVDLTNEPTDWSSIFRAGPRRRNTPRVQRELTL